jgi:hypothetical protein
MAEIVLRVRLIGGERLDVTYEEAGSALDETMEHAISALAEERRTTLQARRSARSTLQWGCRRRGGGSARRHSVTSRSPGRLRR